MNPNTQPPQQSSATRTGRKPIGVGCWMILIGIIISIVLPTIIIGILSLAIQPSPSDPEGGAEIGFLAFPFLSGGIPILLIGLIFFIVEQVSHVNQRRQETRPKAITPPFTPPNETTSL